MCFSPITIKVEKPIDVAHFHKMTHQEFSKLFAGEKVRLAQLAYASQVNNK